MKQTTGYINAGGRGTRLNTIFEPDPDLGIAKALIEVGQPPIKLIDHHIASLSRVALRNVIVGAGDQAEVATHVKAAYSRSADVLAVSASAQHGTAGDLLVAINDNSDAFGDRVLITNCDTILDINTNEFVDFHKSIGAAVSIALTRNRNVPNEDAFYVDGTGNVVYSAEAKDNPISLTTAEAQTVQRGSSTGALVIERAFLEGIAWEPADGQLSLYRNVMGEALRQRAVAGYDNGYNFFNDIGTVQAWTEAQVTGNLQPHLVYSSSTGQM